ncbi:MAG: hypothetical protein ACK46O_12080 [Flavobacteriia bacterium]|jgi:hypothetical protein
MKIDFKNIYQHIISMDDFRLKWRFTDDMYDNLPDIHLDQLKPLDSQASKFIWDYISNTNLHNDFPFNKELFHTVETVRIQCGNEKEIRKWLFQRGVPFNKNVFLSWQPEDAMIVPWKLLIKYFDSFYYGGDDLTIIDESLNWSILFYHEDEVYFGAKL